MQSPASELKFSYPNKFIRAGAGAGKTTQLISTFVDFVQKFKAVHQKYPKVILTTFTRKSTQEIKERLLKQALKINDSDLFAYMNKKSFVHISTIHGVLGLFLNQYQELIGLSTDFKVLDKQQIKKQNFKELKSILKSETHFIELLEHYSFKDLLEHLDRGFEFSNEQQKIQFLNETDLKNFRQKEISKILAVIETLTELPTPEGKGWAEHFEYLNQIGQALKINDLATALKIFENKKKKPNFSSTKPPFDEELHEEMQKYFKDDKSILCQLDTDEYISENHKINQLFSDLLQKFTKNIKESRRQRNEITISDLETLTLEIIRLYPQAAKQFSSEYDYFMIDEFQDTSPVQLNILNQFISGLPHFIVGDPQQSIYLFRGARSEVFLTKQKQAESGNYENIRLNTNYRSRPSLMKFMNQYFLDFSKAFDAMIPKTVDVVSESSFSEGYFIRAVDENLSAINHVQKLLKMGAKASDICILSKKNSVLMDLAQMADKYNLPVQLMVAAGFDDRREILDLVSLLRFLVNPFDNENLIQLLRSPWFEMTDNDIVQFRQLKSENHFWIQLKNSHHIDAVTLNSYLKQFKKNGVLQTAIHFVNQSGMLKSSQYLDSSGKKEANIWKFIQSLRDQINHKTFHLNEYLSFQFSSLQADLASNLSEAQPVVSPDRVSLMTIHNAKGLQFEHVLVLGFSAPPQTVKSMTFSKDETTGFYNLGIFSFEDAQIQNSYWGQAQRKLFNEREIAESERLLYVAMTRAMTSVALISEERKIKYTNSWFGKSNWPEISGAVVTEDYKFESIIDDQKPEILSRTLTTESKVSEPYQILIEQTSSNESVTAKVSSGESKNNEISKYFIENLNKAKTGTDLHKFFEALKYNSLSDVQAMTNETNKKYLNYLLAQTEIPLDQILKHGFAEWGFGLKHENKMIQGQIDAWGIYNDVVYILDYKTGSSEYLQKAFDQLNFYAICLKEMNQIKEPQKIILGVIYPVEEKVFKKEVSFKDLKLTVELNF
jgi:ATP-dependent helicase/nuclease subunit A